MAYGLTILTPPPIEGVPLQGHTQVVDEPRYGLDHTAAQLSAARLATGAKIARIGHNWSWVSWSDVDRYDWSRLDRMVDNAYSTGWRICLTTGYGHPSWSNGGKWRYSEWPRWIGYWIEPLVARYADRVEAFEFSNEPFLPEHSDPIPTRAELLHASLEFGRVVRSARRLPVVGALSPIAPDWEVPDLDTIAILDRNVPAGWAISSHAYGATTAEIRDQMELARRNVRPSRKLWWTECGLDLRGLADPEAAIREVAALDDRYTVPFLYVLHQWEPDPAGRVFEVAPAFGRPSSDELMAEAKRAAGVEA